MKQTKTSKNCLILVYTGSIWSLYTYQKTRTLQICCLLGFCFDCFLRGIFFNIPILFCNLTKWTYLLCENYDKVKGIFVMIEEIVPNIRIIQICDIFP